MWHLLLYKVLYAVTLLGITIIILIITITIMACLYIYTAVCLSRAYRRESISVAQLKSSSWETQKRKLLAG